MGFFSWRSVKNNNLQVFPRPPALLTAANQFVSACIHKNKMIIGMAGSTPNISIMNQDLVTESTAITPFFGNVGMVSNGQRIFTSTPSGNVNYSDDDGLTWLSVAASIPAPGMGAMACNGNTILSMNNLGVRGSADNGASWIQSISNGALDWTNLGSGTNKGMLKFFPELGLFVCGGQRQSGPLAGKFIYSFDGFNWIAGLSFVGVAAVLTCEYFLGEWYFFLSNGSIIKTDINFSNPVSVVSAGFPRVSVASAVSCVAAGTIYCFADGIPLKLLGEKFVILPSNLNMNLAITAQFALDFGRRVWGCGSSTGSSNLISFMSQY